MRRLPQVQVVPLELDHAGERVLQAGQVCSRVERHGQPYGEGLDQHPRGVLLFEIGYGHFGDAYLPVRRRVDQPFALQHPQGLAKRRAADP